MFQRVNWAHALQDKGKGICFPVIRGKEVRGYTRKKTCPFMLGGELPLHTRKEGSIYTQE